MTMTLYMTMTGMRGSATDSAQYPDHVTPKRYGNVTPMGRMQGKYTPTPEDTRTDSHVTRADIAHAVDQVEASDQGTIQDTPGNVTPNPRAPLSAAERQRRARSRNKGASRHACPDCGHTHYDQREVTQAPVTVTHAP